MHTVLCLPIRLRGVALAVIASVALTVDGAAAAEFSQLVRCIPPDANALILIDVEQTLAAPLAQRQGWSRDLEEAYVERPVYLPPEASKLAIGGRLDFRDDLAPMWEAAVIALPEPLSMRSLAARDRGHVETIGEAQSAWTPSGNVYFELPDSLLGVVARAERQFVARLIDRADSAATGRLSEYLTASTRLVTDKTQILFAIDLTAAASARRVEDKLSAASWFADSKLEAAEAARLIAGVRGAALRVAVGDECQAQLQIDFTDETEPLKRIAKSLVLGKLADLGVAAGDLDSWNFSVQGRQILARGPLSTDGQRRLFSVLELPQTDLAPTGGTSAEGPTESQIRQQSLAYFHSIQTLLKDLRRGLKESKATTSWMERYARRIDNLPVLNVDDQLLEYGDKLAETLRIMALSKRQAGIRSGVRRSQGTGYYYDADAYEDASDATAARKEEYAVAQDTIVEGWRLIDDATAEIRRDMTQKYQTEF